VDSQGVLKVGPRSAGADPGPVCYDLGGTEPTITDCYLLIGYIHSDHFLGGRRKLDRAAAEAALSEIARRCGIEGKDRAVKAAEAALKVATAVMSTELYKSLAQRGQDPRDFALMPFGGAGPTHGNLLADEARLTTVVVPPAPATFCAMGAILADVKRDYVRSRHLKLASGEADIETLAATFREIEDEARAWIATEGALLGKPVFAATCDMRYAGQAFDLQVAIPEKLRLKPDAAALTERFHQEHEKIYGFRDADSGVEITTERLQVIGKIPPIELPEVANGTGQRPRSVQDRRIFHRGASLTVPVYLRPELRLGDKITGPAIVEQEDCTIWIIPGWSGQVDRIGNLILTSARAPRRSSPAARVARRRSPGQAISPRGTRSLRRARSR
ncbi:MAG: hydantoinase/oxoprolinase family protein, partial [Armatimonadetes bacterium]|nr:hydantoinase/oxoprolinase family protein [Armatimonadota bacterium]